MVQSQVVYAADALDLVDELHAAVVASSIHAPILARFLTTQSPSAAPELLQMEQNSVRCYHPEQWWALLDALHLPVVVFGTEAATFVANNLQISAAAADAAASAAAFAGSVHALASVAAGVPDTRHVVGELLTRSTRQHALSLASDAVRGATRCRSSNGSDAARQHAVAASPGALFGGGSGAAPGTPAYPAPHVEKELFADAIATSWGRQRSQSPGTSPPPQQHANDELAVDAAGSPAQAQEGLKWLPAPLSRWGTASALTSLAMQLMRLAHVAPLHRAGAAPSAHSERGASPAGAAADMSRSGAGSSSSRNRAGGLTRELSFAGDVAQTPRLGGSSGLRHVSTGVLGGQGGARSESPSDVSAGDAAASIDALVDALRLCQHVLVEARPLAARLAAPQQLAGPHAALPADADGSGAVLELADAALNAALLVRRLHAVQLCLSTALLVPRVQAHDDIAPLDSHVVRTHACSTANHRVQPHVS